MKPKITQASCETVLVYVTDCNLATVCNMAMASRRPKGEFDRQINIAQIAQDWLVQNNTNLRGSRSEDVRDKFNNSVRDWAESFIHPHK